MSEREKMIETVGWQLFQGKARAFPVNWKEVSEIAADFAIAIRDEALAEAPLYKQGYDAGYCNGLAAAQARIEKLEAALRHYADESFWEDPPQDAGYATTSQYCYEDEFDGMLKGPDIAQTALREMEGEGK